MRYLSRCISSVRNDAVSSCFSEGLVQPPVTQMSVAHTTQHSTSAVNATEIYYIRYFKYTLCVFIHRAAFDIRLLQIQFYCYKANRGTGIMIRDTCI